LILTVFGCASLRRSRPRRSVIDWNRDGRVDIFTVKESGNIVTPYLGNGDGTIDAPIAPPFVDNGGGGGGNFFA
jgi:hypothetical protein